MVERCRAVQSMARKGKDGNVQARQVMDGQSDSAAQDREEQYSQLLLEYVYTINIYPTKMKRTTKMFPLSSPLNAKMPIVTKYLFLIKSYLNSNVA